MRRGLAACSAQLVGGAGDQPRRPAAIGEIHAGGEVFAGLGALLAATQRRAELHQRARVFQTGLRGLQQRDRLAQQLDSRLATFEHAGGPQGDAQRPRQTDVLRQA